MVNTKQPSLEESMLRMTDRLSGSNKKHLNPSGISLINWPSTSRLNPPGSHSQFADYSSEIFVNMVLSQIESTTRTVYDLKEDMSDITLTLNKMQENQRVMMQKIDDTITEEKDNLAQSLDSEKTFDSETINPSKKNQTRPQKPVRDLVTFVITFSTMAILALMILPTLHSYVVAGFCVLVIVLGIMINREKNVQYTKFRFHKN